MIDSRGHDEGYQCIEPDLGQDIWRLDLPDLAAEEFKLLNDHLRLCDACRLYGAMDRKFGEGLANGSLALPGDRDGEKFSPPVAWLSFGSRIPAFGAGLALAASLLLVFMLPPEARDGGLVSRAGFEAPFVRPVEGEVIARMGTYLSWRKIQGASKYLVRIDEVGGDFQWSGESRGLSLALPTANDMPRGADFRAYLTPVPQDLAPTEGLSVSFRTDSYGAFLHYRLGAAAWPARWLGLGGLLVGCWALSMRLRGRRWRE